MTKFHDYADEHGGYDFNCHEDFIKFLEKRNKSHVTSNSSHDSQTNKTGEENNKKRSSSSSSSSWKNLFFSYLKSYKKQRLSSCSVRLEHVSSPVEGNCSSNVTTRKARKSVSGPLTCFSCLTDRADEYSEVPYTSLCRVRNDHKLQLYGPIYFVP